MDRESKKIDIQSPDPGYENFPVSIMNRSTYEAVSFDPTLGKPATISYRINKAGCIRIRIVRRDLPDMLIRTLQDWTHQEFGRYKITWDGKDASGNIIDNTKIQVVFESKDRDRGLLHEGHDDAACHDSVLTLTPGQDTARTVKGKLTIQARMPAAAHSNDLQARCYIDSKPFEAASCSADNQTFDITLDTAAIGDGEHLLTINLDDQHDHIGTAGLKFSVKNA